MSLVICKKNREMFKTEPEQKEKKIIILIQLFKEFNKVLQQGQLREGSVRL